MIPRGSNGTQQLCLRSDMSELRRLGEWVRHWGEQLSLRQETVNCVHLCLIEAVTNVIVHGGDRVSREGISLSIHGQRDIVTIRMTDGGRPFDPVGYVLPPKPKSLQESKIGGHGIRIMRELATSISYERRAGRNCLALVFAR
jgi:serine/threonine-protein kinase RsbW